MYRGQEKCSNIATSSTQKESSEEVDFEKKWLMSLLSLKSESTGLLCASGSNMAPHSTVVHVSFYLQSNATVFPKENVTALIKSKLLAKLRQRWLFYVDSEGLTCMRFEMYKHL